MYDRLVSIASAQPEEETKRGSEEKGMNSLSNLHWRVWTLLVTSIEGYELS